MSKNDREFQISTLGPGSSIGPGSPIPTQSSRRERNGVESKGRPPKIRAAPNFTGSKLAPSCSPTTPDAMVCTGSATGIATECSESCTAYLTDYYGNATKWRHRASACLRRRECMVLPSPTPQLQNWNTRLAYHRFSG